MKKDMPRLPRSVRKYIRREKARIRAAVSDTKEAEKKISEFVFALRGLYSKDKIAR